MQYYSKNDMRMIQEKTRQGNGMYHVSQCCGRLLDFIEFNIFDHDYVCRGCKQRAFLGGKFINASFPMRLAAVIKEDI